MGQCLLSSLGSGARIQGRHGREMNLSNAVEGWRALRGAQHLARHNLGLASESFDGQRHMFLLIDLLESSDVRGTRIDHDQLHSNHFMVLSGGDVKTLT